MSYVDKAQGLRGIRPLPRVTTRKPHSTPYLMHWRRQTREASYSHPSNPHNPANLKTLPYPSPQPSAANNSSLLQRSTWRHLTSLLTNTSFDPLSDLYIVWTQASFEGNQAAYAHNRTPPHRAFQSGSVPTAQYCSTTLHPNLGRIPYLHPAPCCTVINYIVLSPLPLTPNLSPVPAEVPALTTPTTSSWSPLLGLHAREGTGLRPTRPAE